MKTSQRVRAHYLLDDNDSKGPERLSRYYEELNGNRLLDENSTFAPLGEDALQDAGVARQHRSDLGSQMVGR